MSFSHFVSYSFAGPTHGAALLFEQAALLWPRTSD
jgi:hypothetical protein